jgi:hypothetical protein
MKKNIFLATMLLLLAILNSSSNMPDYSYWHGDYKPVFMKRADLERSVSYQAQPRELINPGKIYSLPPYLYVNERYKGIHIINNSDPVHPLNEGFIMAPGCLDIAVKGEMMYIDNSVDLVTFDLVNKKVTQRLPNVFPEPIAPDNTFWYGSREQDMHIVEWKKNTSNL